MSSLSTAAPPRRGLSTPLGMVAAFASAAVAASLVNVLISIAAHAAGAPQVFGPLFPSVFVVFSIVGVLAGVVGWTVIRARSVRPAAVLRWLVPTILLLSLIPDILVGVSRPIPGTTWTGVVALMLMHVVVTVAAVLSLRKFLPLHNASR